MKNSLKAFMGGIIDYAGLFPPAGLSLDTAIRNYADYRQSEDSWMLSRFIIPAGKLEDLEPYGNELFSKSDPFDFSVLGSGTDTLSEFKQELEQAMDACQAFNNRHGDDVKTDVFEIKLPREAALSGDKDLVCDALDAAAAFAGKLADTPQFLFFESYLEESWKKDLLIMVEALSDHNKSQSANENYSYAGFKLRCGGIKAEMFPEVEQVAFAINMAREYNVAMKCTAGLHHPVRHYDDTVQTKMHGFFNVFGGAMLSYGHDLGDEELQQILREEDPDQFTFAENEFGWQDLFISSKEIRELREVALISFGSCSFDEPREDLQKLNLL